VDDANGTSEVEERKPGAKTQEPACVATTGRLLVLDWSYAFSLMAIAENTKPPVPIAGHRRLARLSVL